MDDLPEADALALIAGFQPLRDPEHRLLPDNPSSEQKAKAFRGFASDKDEAAAREIVRELGGFTLAIELVAAHLQAHARDGATCV